GTGDFNGDGKTDVLLRNVNGLLADWTMSGAQISAADLLTMGANAITLDSTTAIAGVGDFNGDGKSDILIRTTDGSLTEWIMSGPQVASSSAITFQGSSGSSGTAPVIPHGPTIAV